MNKKFILGATLLFAQQNYAAINKDAIRFYHPTSVVVAIVDTGTDIKHEELKDSIWTNPGETGLDAFGRNKETNGIDDDGNGFADDVHGWNFISNTNNVTDTIGHGTHIAGIIKSEYKKHIPRGTSSEAVRLMILKYYDPNGKDIDNIRNSTRAIEYANKMGAQVINYSGGGSIPYGKELLAIQESAKKEILFVAAAGNNNANTDVEKFYPASYSIDNIISVAATNNQGELMNFSNYGKAVDIAAPGEFIYSTLPKQKHGFLSGTSQATGYVSGVIASLIANKTITAKNIRSELAKLGQKSTALKGKTKSQVALMFDGF